MAIDVTTNQIRIRVRNPKLFDEYRTIDPGKPGHFMIVLGKLRHKPKSGRRWIIQSYRFSRFDVDKAGDVLIVRTKKYANLLRNIRNNFGLKYKIQLKKR